MSSGDRAALVTYRCLLLLLLCSVGISCRARQTTATTTPDELRGRSRLENVAAEGSMSIRVRRTGWEEQMFPPLSSHTILPDYPRDALAPGAPPVHVRVSFTVGTDGRAHDVNATALEEVPRAELFARSSEEAIRRWRFSPAWRLARGPDEGDGGLVLLYFKTRVVFRFDVEAGGGRSTLDPSTGGDLPPTE